MFMNNNFKHIVNEVFWVQDNLVLFVQLKQLFLIRLLQLQLD